MTEDMAELVDTLAKVRDLLTAIPDTASFHHDWIEEMLGWYLPGYADQDEEEE